MNKENLFIEASEKLLNASKLFESKKINKDISTSEIYLDKKLAKEIDKRKGYYTTIYFNNLNNNLDILLKEITSSIKRLMNHLNINNNDKILLIGLGNKNISSDSLGYYTTEKVEVKENNYKIYKDTIYNTNISNISFIKSLIKELKINLVIVVDSLKANDLKRLNKTIQLSTSGINPGSALNNNYEEISERTLKVPVISIGVPTIINIKPLLKENLKEDLIVTNKLIDAEIDNISSILSIALNKIL